MISGKNGMYCSLVKLLAKGTKIIGREYVSEARRLGSQSECPVQAAVHFVWNMMKRLSCTPDSVSRD